VTETEKTSCDFNEVDRRAMTGNRLSAGGGTPLHRVYDEISVIVDVLYITVCPYLIVIIGVRKFSCSEKLFCIYVPTTCNRSNFRARQ